MAKFYFKRTVVSVIIAALLLLFSVATGIASGQDTDTTAFPGAEGAGKFTKGGRGGDVYHVTTLQDSGPGSLRQGIESIKGPRTIVFDISGMIRLKTDLEINDKSYLTIAGQTAPGKGITLADRALKIKNSRHIIVRYLRVRLGDENKPAESGPDCITVEYNDHIILDHLSLSWGIDGNGDFRGLKHSTVQWSIFSEALHDSLHKKGGHAMCTSFRDPQGVSTLHHNIYASSRARHPSVTGGPEVMEFCNNVDYNWERGHNISGDQFNLINNYYKAGPSMKAGHLPLQFKSGKKPPTSRGYFSGNYFEGLSEKYNQDNFTAMDYHSSGLGFGTDHNYQDTTRKKFEFAKRFDAGKYKMTKIESASDAYESCLKYSGCSLVRDTVDERFINTIIDNTGKIIDSQNEVGGWDMYPSVSRPVDFDTDHDGMPDGWERSAGLNPNEPADGNKDRNNDGFTNLEEYINSLTQRKETTDQPTIAFPGAEGYGRFAQGGRGGDVYIVSNLEDDGVGSLRYGIENMNGPRTIVFAVSGTIALKSPLEITDSNLTIAGQTAPGDGICIKDHGLKFDEVNDVIMRYIRIRMGDQNKGSSSGADCITSSNISDVIFDHISAGWGIDAIHDNRVGGNFTLQWSIYGETLHDSIHYEKMAHSKLGSFRETTKNISIHHNLLHSTHDRHPSMGGAELTPADLIIDFRNNLIYNAGGTTNLGGARRNVINNYYKNGPDTKTGNPPMRIKAKPGKGPAPKGFTSGNVFTWNQVWTGDNYSAIKYVQDGDKYLSTSQAEWELPGELVFGADKPATDTAKDAYRKVLKYAGASKSRDACDKRIINEVKTSTGKVPDSQDEVGGWPTLKSLPAPTDADKDGMADDWEAANRLNPNDAEDRNEDRDSDGFTNLEEYINSLVANPVLVKDG